MKLRNPFGAIACCIAGIIISPILFLLWYIAAWQEYRQLNTVSNQLLPDGCGSD
jgi:hypothetical protein